MYCKKLPRNYPAWLTKKMGLGMNTLLKKGTKQRGSAKNGSDSN